MKIQHNLAAMKAVGKYSNNSKGLSTNLERLSSGYSINKAADNAAGLSISEKMRSQLKGLDQGIDNCRDGVAFNQVADGTMNEISSILNRMEELTVQASNGTYDDFDRQQIQEEINRLNLEMERIFSSTNFNNINIFNDNELINSGLNLYGVVDAAGNVNRSNLGTLLGTDHVYQGDTLEYDMEIVDLAKWSSTAPATGNTNKALQNGHHYEAAWIDFSGLGSDYQVADLENMGFSSTCDHGCKRYYSIVFTNNAQNKTTAGSSINYSYVDNAKNPILTINISDCTDGKDVVNHIMEAASSESDFLKHWQQYAVNSDEPGKIYVFDDEAHATSGQNIRSQSTFDVRARDALGNIIAPEQNEAVNDNPKVEGGIWIQSGDTTGDGFYIQKPYLNVSALGTEKINVSTQEGAEKAIGIVKKAVNIVSQKRGMVGAQQNRCEHAAKVTMEMVQNITASESQIRDTDMSEEMTRYSLNNVLTQTAQAMLAHANSTPEGVIQLLG